MPRLTLHTLAIVVSLLLYVLTTRAERERRPPSIAIAWVLGMFALPYAALPLFLMFGRRKLRRGMVAPLPGPRPGTHWAEGLIASFGVPPAAQAQVRWHQDGAASQAALWELIDGACARLDIATFIFGHDAFGDALGTRLIERAGAGVRVRLLIDGVGIWALSGPQARRLRDAGIELRVFSPLFARTTRAPRNLRNHRKLVIADHAALWAGGRNLAAEYFAGTPAMPAWRDLTFDLTGPVALAAAGQFESDWTSSSGAHAGPIGTPAEPTGPSRVQFLPSGPDQAEDTVHALLLDACFRAEQRVLAVTPYLVPDEALITALRLAARRGVRVDLCLPARSNHGLADFARNRALRSLSDAGVRVHLAPGMVHAKAIVFDESLAVSGSPNLDSRSLLLNYESAFVFYSAQDILWLTRWIEALIAESRAFVNQPPGLWRDLAEGLLLTVAYQL